MDSICAKKILKTYQNPFKLQTLEDKYEKAEKYSNLIYTSKGFSGLNQYVAK